MVPRELEARTMVAVVPLGVVVAVAVATTGEATAVVGMGVVTEVVTGLGLG